MFFVVLSPHRCSAVCAYQNAPRLGYFIVAPQQFALEGRVAEADGPGNEAYFYTVASLMPFKAILFQLEIPYISYVSSENVRNQFGDPVFRMRVRLWNGGRSALHLLSGVRAGSLPFFESNEDLYPYSTGTLDFSLGGAFVDTVATVAWWVAGSGSYATRVDTTLEDSYGNYATGAAGVFVPVSSQVDVQAGAFVCFQTGLPAQQTYYAEIDLAYSRAVGFYLFAQVEGGSKSTRAMDYSAGFGTTVTF